PPPNTLGIPDALMMFTDTVLAIDNVFGRAHAITLIDVDGVSDEVELDRRYDEAAARLDQMIATLAAADAPAPLPLPASTQDVEFESSCSREMFESHVERIRDYIRAGDA